MRTNADIDTKIRDTLSYIKDNPGCSTNKVSAEVRVNCLDGNLLDDLHDQDLIKGTRIRSCDSFGADYLDLRLTVDGEERLESLIAGDAKETPWRRSKTLFKWAVGVVVTIGAGLAVIWLSHLLGW